MKIELTEILKNDNFQNLISDVSEATLDTFLKEGLLKEMPIFGLVANVINFSNTIQDKLYTKKLLTFLKQLEKTKLEDRQNEVEKIDSDKKYKTKVGEKILYLINDADDCEKTEYIGILFKHFLERKLSYDDFIRCVNCINRTNIIDLNAFINEIFIESFIERNLENYLNTGLISQEYKNPMNETNKNRLITFEKAQIKYNLSRPGNYIRRYLNKNNTSANTVFAKRGD
ncbi:hypothetical protein PG291_06735 [Riemerella anatipestifer]|nr:hypothetical protein [Riemerella anatipestifer]